MSTSITAFVGRAPVGQINRAVRVQSFTEYLREFGAPEPEPELGYSVRPFLLNGGGEALIVRIGASSARLTLKAGT